MYHGANAEHKVSRPPTRERMATAMHIWCMRPLGEATPTQLSISVQSGSWPRRDGVKQDTGRKGASSGNSTSNIRDTRTDMEKQRRTTTKTGDERPGRPTMENDQKQASSSRKSRLAAFGAEGTGCKSKTVRRPMAGVGLAGSAQQGPPRCSCTSGLGTPIRQELLDGVWSVGCVSHRLGVVARSKSDGAVASPSTRGPCWGSIDSRTLKEKGLFGSWRYWRRVFARS
ncbi:hypothetical protein CCMA1212_006038 [Trichoderma ghanense]|uniref:Uncharacterized protein n=1 Tax=Trichoderma ghanense TaxID=65468 RepID=A0ABY2H3Q2_9HYPO